MLNGSVLLTTRSARSAPAMGLMVGYFRANHATGVSSLTRLAGKFSKPGSTTLRYSRTGICSLRHVSTIEMMAATRGPACSLPTWIQFLRLWKDFHKKKNWLFFGDADAGERSAIIYSIIESCRRHGIEPYTYLHDVLTRLPSIGHPRHCQSPRCCVILLLANLRLTMSMILEARI